MTTQIARISEVYTANPYQVFEQFIHHFYMRALLHWYERLNGKAARGINGFTKVIYRHDLLANLEDLHYRLKQLAYRLGPLREQLISKEGKPSATRPLGISNFEEEIAQKGVHQVWEAIYEPLFLGCSFCLRPGLGCHDAIRALRTHLYSKPVSVVLNVDLANFFNTIEHELLMAMIEEKIQEQHFLCYLRRMLKAGVLSEGELIVSDEGVPQRSFVSPILANIYLHNAIDDWF
jgi:retron-type reverse transcriptase